MEGTKFIPLFICFFLLVSIAGAQLSEDWVLEHARNSKAVYDEGASVVLFSGDVRITNGGDSYESDSFRYEERLNRIFMSGNVVVNAGGYEIASQYMEYDTVLERAVFYGGVKAGKESALIDSDRAVFLKAGNKMEFYEDVSFVREDARSFSEYLLYDGSGDSIMLTGMPYLSMDDDYIGGDKIILSLVDGESINSVDVYGHGDLHWTGTERVIDLTADYIKMDFNGNDPEYVHASGGVYSVMADLEEENRLECEFMDVFFEEGEIARIKVTGNPRGSRDSGARKE